MFYFSATLPAVLHPHRENVHRATHRPHTSGRVNLQDHPDNFVFYINHSIAFSMLHLEQIVKDFDTIAVLQHLAPKFYEDDEDQAAPYMHETEILRIQAKSPVPSYSCPPVIEQSAPSSIRSATLPNSSLRRVSHQNKETL